MLGKPWTDWYSPTSFRAYDADGTEIESFSSDVTGRGMQFQAAELERLVAAGATSGDILPTEETVAVLETLDAIRAQIGLSYPGE